MLLVEVLLIDQAHQRQASVYFSQVHHDVLLNPVFVSHLQLNNTTRLVVELAVATGLLVSINARHIDEHVNQLTADFVLLHVYRRVVSCDVDFRYDVKQERLFNQTSLNQRV